MDFVTLGGHFENITSTLLEVCGEYSDNIMPLYMANATIWLVHLQDFWYNPLGLFVEYAFNFVC